MNMFLAKCTIKREMKLCMYCIGQRDEDATMMQQRLREAQTDRDNSKGKERQKLQPGKGEDREFEDREQCPSQMIVAYSSREQGEHSSLAHPE